MNNKSEKNISMELAQAPIGRLMLKLAIPTVLAQLVNLLYNVIDRIYIGHMKGDGNLALTGIGICFPIITILNAFAMLIGQGGAPRASIAMGNNDNKTAEKILANCFNALICLAIVLTGTFLIFGEKLLWVFGASENTINYASSYMQIYVSGSIFVMIALGLNSFITAQGFAKFSMITVLVGAVSNIILDPIFIFVLKMGVKGAALATVISQALSAIFVLCFLFGKKTMLKIKKENMHFEKRIMLPVIALGVSPFIMQATEAALNISFNFSLQKYGGDTAVGAMTIASTIMQMVWLPSNGIGQGAQPIISYNYGAGNTKRVRKAFKTLLSVSCIYMVTAWVLIQLFAGVFVKIFNSSAVELYDMTVWAMHIYTAVLFMFGIQMSIQQTFLATGQAKASLFIACLRKLILLMPLIFILPLFFEDKVFAVFLAEPVSDAISVITAAIIFAVKFPKMMKEIEKN